MGIPVEDRVYAEEARRIRAVRDALGLNQSEFAKRLGNLNRTRVNNWECGLNHPRPAEMRTMYQVFGITADYIIHGHIHTLPGDLIGPVRERLGQRLM